MLSGRALAGWRDDLNIPSFFVGATMHALQLRFYKCVGGSSQREREAEIVVVTDYLRSSLNTEIDLEASVNVS